MTAGEIFPGLNVSRETEGRLRRFVQELTRWNASINLVAPSTLQDVWSRHIRDSSQLFSLAPEKSKKWVDIGTGGGFPGLVIAILAHELKPELRVTCIESDKRKAAFLTTQSNALGLETTIIAKRIEAAPIQHAHVISARALAPLPQLLRHAQRHLAPTGTALFLKGAAYASEVHDASADWRFRYSTYPSKTDASGVILKLGEIEHV